MDFLWLYVVIMSRTRFEVNLHSIVAWISRNSLLETDTISKVWVISTGIEVRELHVHLRTNGRAFDSRWSHYEFLIGCYLTTRVYKSIKREIKKHTYNHTQQLTRIGFYKHDYLNLFYFLIMPLFSLTTAQFQSLVSWIQGRI